QLIQESVRIISHNIDLTIALDNSLERIERVDATSAFSAFEDVSTVIAKEQPADYIFGKLPTADSRDSSSVSSMTSPSRYGFFSLGGKQIPNTIGEEGEVVKLAVQRLAPKLKNLLAAKLWRLTDNEASSCLQVKASMEINNGISPRTVMQQKTGRNLEPQKNLTNQSGNRASIEGIPTVPIGSRMQYRVQNLGEIPLYLILLGLDTSKNAVALYPWDEIEEDDASQTKPVLRDITIEPGETRVIPQSTAGFEWVAKGLVSWCETQLVFSTAPFSKSLKALENSKHSGAKQERVLALLNPLEVAEAMLLDLHHASNDGVDTGGSNVDSYILNVNNWAGLSFVYQVV
ncbi:MAG: peptidase C14, partial [Cyanobacteria bacterium J06639_18]